MLHRHERPRSTTPTACAWTGSEFYMKSEEEMRAAVLLDRPELPCDTTLEIADKCYVRAGLGPIMYLPRVPLAFDPGETRG